MTEDRFAELIRAAASGFAEGLIRATYPLTGATGHVPHRVAHESSTQTPLSENDSLEDEYQAFIQTTENAAPLEPAAVTYGRPPEELHAAMSAITNPVPEGHFDPLAQSEARPVWLQE